MKIYVDKNEQEFHPDEFVADNTILISEFNEIETEISHETVKVESLQEHDKEVKKKILQQIKDFINEIAWDEVKDDAFMSTMGEFSGSPSAIPRYAKKYINLWNQMFPNDIIKETEDD